MVDIFKIGETGETPKVDEWARPTKWNVGDSIQGTYIGMFEGMDGFNNQQVVYTLLCEDGKTRNVPFKATATRVIERMNELRAQMQEKHGREDGFVVGFSLMSTTPSTKYKDTSGKPIQMKNFAVHANLAHADGINQEYLKNGGKAVGNNRVSLQTVVASSSVPPEEAFLTTPSPEAVKPMDNNLPEKDMSNAVFREVHQKVSTDQMEQLRSVARSVGVASESMSDAEVDERILKTAKVEEIHALNLEDVLIAVAAGGKE